MVSGARAEGREQRGLRFQVLGAAEVGPLPLVSVFEDLQWSDPATLDVVAAVAERDDPATLLVVGTYRPVDAVRAADVRSSAKATRETLRPASPEFSAHRTAIWCTSDILV